MIGAIGLLRMELSLVMCVLMEAMWRTTLLWLGESSERFYVFTFSYMGLELRVTFCIIGIFLNTLECFLVWC